MYLDLNVNRDGMKEDKVAKTVVRIKVLAQMTTPIAELFALLLLTYTILSPNSPHGGSSRVGAYLSESSLRMGRIRGGSIKGGSLIKGQRRGHN